jgi:hypothetical protein
MLLRRPTFGVLQHVYRYAAVAGRRRFALWPSVGRELLSLLSLAPLLRTSLSAPFCPRMLASDASSTGGGVVVTTLTQRLGDVFWRLHFGKQHVAQPGEAQSSAVATPSAQPCLVAEPRWPAGQDQFAVLAEGPWRTLISTQWRFPEHINALELRALELAIRWLLSRRDACGSRVFALLDNAVAFYSVRKGRGGSAHLLPLLRRTNALLLASHVALLPIWVPSGANPADAPSRA